MTWTALQGLEKAQIESRFGLPALRSDFQAFVDEPSYYRRGALVRLEAFDRKRHYIAAGEGPVSTRRFFLLDGTSEPVHEGNLAAGIDINTTAEAESYLRFFCGVLHMTDGNPIRIVDALQPGWVTDSRENIDIAPAAVWASERPGLFNARAHVEFAGVLLIADFAIQSDGIVAMLEDEPLGRLVRRETK